MRCPTARRGCTRSKSNVRARPRSRCRERLARLPDETVIERRGRRAGLRRRAVVDALQNYGSVPAPVVFHVSDIMVLATASRTGCCSGTGDVTVNHGEESNERGKLIYPARGCNECKRRCVQPFTKFSGWRSQQCPSANRPQTKSDWPGSLAPVMSRSIEHGRTF
jgi:hypothetical protein